MTNHGFDRLWGMDGINPFGHPGLFEDYLRHIMSVDNLTPQELQSFMEDALERQDYEKAAEIRDELKLRECR